MSQKQTPKSCSCQHCKHGKGSARGKWMMRHDERAFRHAQKVALNKGSEDIGIAPKGNYFD